MGPSAGRRGVSAPRPRACCSRAGAGPKPCARGGRGDPRWPPHPGLGAFLGQQRHLPGTVRFHFSVPASSSGRLARLTSGEEAIHTRTFLSSYFVKGAVCFRDFRESFKDTVSSQFSPRSHL